MVGEPGGPEYRTERFVQDTEGSATPRSSLVLAGASVSPFAVMDTRPHICSLAL